MSSSRRPGLWNSPRVWLIIAAVIALPFLVEFNARLTQSRELESQQAALTQQIDAEHAKQAALLKLQAWIKSDDYIEYWARTFARMTKPNEVAVVPVASQSNPAPSNTRGTAIRTNPNDILSEWWTAFFGETP